ncbi:hypothetical protein Fmac_024005 [Flemingia macrophylla]|uniref:Uncharacterized protein n=1 Tax=Flemingia macrophylla TaxID=520843 RepID=A0ABD1LN64_9FABA
MSTDLHLHHHLSKLRIAAVKLQEEEEEDAAAAQGQASSVVDTPPPPPPENKESSAVEDDSYRTPTSKESRIPAMMTCPPAPKKAKPFISCKRKLLDEFQFFEVTNKEDMDAFFRSTFPKRTCPCT